jgi:hypothetical protein
MAILNIGIIIPLTHQTVTEFMADELVNGDAEMLYIKASPSAMLIIGFRPVSGLMSDLVDRRIAFPRRNAVAVRDPL